MSKQFYFFRKEGNLYRIDPDKILFMEANENYVKFFEEDTHHIVRTTLDAALSQLPGDQFAKIHRSYAVSLAHIDSITRDFVRVASTAEEIPVSKKFYDSLVEKIRIIEAKNVTGE